MSTSLRSARCPPGCLAPLQKKVAIARCLLESKDKFYTRQSYLNKDNIQTRCSHLQNEIKAITFDFVSVSCQNIKKLNN